MRYLSAQDMLVLHALVVDSTGGSHGVREPELLQSIAAKPAASFAGKELYPGTFLKAAVLLEAVANYHVFVDGNKRTSFIAASRFLYLNGYTFSPSNKEVEGFVLAVATKEKSITDIAAWLRKHSKKIKKRQ